MDIKRSILWIVFLMSMLFLWDNWMVAGGKQSMFAPPPPKSTKVDGPGFDQLTKTAPAAAQSTAVPVAGSPAAPVAGAGEAPEVKNERINISTDVFKVGIDTVGGELKRLELLKFKDGIDPGKNQLLFDLGQKHAYVAQTGLVGGVNGAVFPNHRTGYVAKPGPRSLEGTANEVQLVLEAVAGGVKLVKTYSFKRGDYRIGVRHEVTNLSGAPITPALYLQLLHDGNTPEGDNYFMSSYTGPTVFTDAKKFQKLTFEEVEKGKAEHETKADNGWTAVVQHFFVSAFVPPDKAPRDIYTEKVDTNLYRIGTRLPLGTLAPNASTVMDATLFSGPQVSSLLDATAPGLDLVKDYGWLTIVAKPMFWLMDQLNNHLGNWGWTIVVFTLLVKLALFPLSAAAYRSMARMKVMTPKMTAIRERYAGDPQKMNQAMMEMYKTEKINPLGGCLPILVQMPVFIALFWVLQASVEMRDAPWIGWIQDLSAPDPWFILPVLMAVSMFIQTKLGPTSPDPVQAKVMLFMPLIFSAMFFFFPSGLVLYYVVNNILSIGQQWVITKKFEEGKA